MSWGTTRGVPGGGEPAAERGHTDADDGFDDLLAADVPGGGVGYELRVRAGVLLEVRLRVRLDLLSYGRWAAAVVLQAQALVVTKLLQTLVRS